MGEQKTPNPKPDQDRDSASRQPAKQFPDENQQPNERASNPGRDPHEDAARRQARQDPLQSR